MRQNEKHLIFWAILVMEFNSLAMSAVSPALENIGIAFPQVTHAALSMLSTLPALICVPVGVLSNALVGKKITFRNMSFIGTFLLICGGIAPIFSQSFSSLLLWRIVFGVGMGVMSPMGGALMFSALSKTEAGNQSSADTISNSVGAIVYQLMGGFLCSRMGWRYTFLIYLLLVPTMGFVLYALNRIRLANTCFLSKHPQDSADPCCEKMHYGLSFWGWCALYGLYCILFYPLVTDMSTLVLNNGYGSADSVSVILSIYTVGGALGGFLYHFKPVRDLNSKIFTLIFSLNALGFFIILRSVNIPMLIAGAFLFGIGYGLFTAAIIIFAGYSVPQALRIGVVARILVFTGIGEFASAFLLAFIKNQVFHSSYDRFSFAFSLVCLLVLAVFFLIKPRCSSFSADDLEELS
jgi:MFS family permease